MGRGVPPSREVGRDAHIAPQGKRFERNNEMTKKLIMMLAVTVAASFGAWADTETVGGAAGTYQFVAEAA